MVSVGSSLSAARVPAWALPPRARPPLPWRTLLLVNTALAVAFAALLWSLHRGDRLGLERDLASQVTQAFAGYDMLVEATLDHNLQVAEVLAQGPRVRELLAAAFRSPPDRRFVLDEIRRALMAELQPVWRTLSGTYGVAELQVHVGPDARTLLRAHASARFGEVRRSDRILPIDVIRSGRPLAAFEIGLSAAGLRGVVPIRAPGGDTTPVIGALEIVSTFAPLLRHARGQLGTDFAVLLQAEQAKALMVEAGDGEPTLTIDGTRWRVDATTSPTLRQLPIDGCRCLGTAAPRIVSSGEGRVWLAARPLVDARDDRPVGWIVAWRSIDAEWQALEQQRRQTLAGGVALLVLSWVAATGSVFFGLRQLRATIDDATEEVRSSNQELARKAETDALTGLANRHAAELLLAASAKHHPAGPQRVSCLLLDIDHFKSINDRFGHDVGDRALMLTAAVIKGAIRVEDAAFRWGGEEFLVVLPEGGQAALQVAERIRAALAAARLVVDGETLAILASIGVAERGPRESLRACLRQADAALYRAKAAGRNRIVVASDRRVSADGALP